MANSLTGELHLRAQSISGTVGSFNEDLYAALCVMFALDVATNGRHLSGLLTLVAGGLPALLRDPTLLTDGGSGERILLESGDDLLTEGGDALRQE